MYSRIWTSLFRILISFADNMNAPIALTLDIVPKVKKIASTATNAADIKTEGKGKNAVQVNENDETIVEVNTPVTITIPMPNDFPAQDGDKIVVKHEKNGQFICYHHATYSATDNTVTFTNDKGFSTFTIKFDNRSAKIQFTDKDGKNIGKQTKYDAFKVNKTLPTTEAPSGYKFTGWSFKSDDETISGTYTVMTEELLTELDNRYKVYTATPVFASTSSSSGEYFLRRLVLQDHLQGYDFLCRERRRKRFSVLPGEGRQGQDCPVPEQGL